MKVSAFTVLLLEGERSADGDVLELDAGGGAVGRPT
jgi:hypothetical protein